MEIDPNKVRIFTDAAQFSKWLAQNHEKEHELWIQIYKKDSGVASIDWEGCVIEALAWGWIDGIKKTCDASSWYQRLTPRKKNSSWSKKNRSHVELLIEQKRIQPAGLAVVEAARADGRWDAAYDGLASFEIPEDFLEAVSKNKKALATYESLNRTNLYTIYHRLQSAKKPETRMNRMAMILEALSRGEKFH